jgi:CRISPR/Cas system CSM-associated protein Csm3 (group 7 of RAMP superfamily)
MGTALFELHSDDPEASPFLHTVVSIFRSHLLLGGNGARGIGRVELAGEALLRCFDLKNLNDHAEFLDERFAVRLGRLPETGQPVDSPSDVSDMLSVQFALSVPRGQDLLIGDGQALDYEIQPQRVQSASGEGFWRLPGSALRGVLRSWVTRLAARDGATVADSCDRWKASGPWTGDEAGWGGVSEESQTEIVEAMELDSESLGSRVECPVMRLFGSLFSAGRVHVSDALAPIKAGLEQERAHLAIDSITGGATESFLFFNSVLCNGPEKKLQFEVTMTIESPTVQEATWLAASLRALDQGIVRVGSSKAGGRLALASAPTAFGPFADRFVTMKPHEDRHA